MKTLFTFIAIVVIHTSIFAQTPVQTHGALVVNGNKILNKNGVPVCFAGNSLFWSNTGWGGENFYNASVINWLYTDWNTPIVRAAMGVEDNGGYISDPSNKQKVITVVDAAINEGIYIIIDWHSHHAEDYETEAIQFFEEMATLYGDYNNVIYELYNEPLNTASWDNTIKPYAESVISAIRAIDSDNLIIVGTSNWSQDVDIASNNPITDYSNIAYTLHFYAGSHGQWSRDKAQTALDNGIAIFVTEWGSSPVIANDNAAVDSTETMLWMDFLCANKISHCNWAVNDKVEPFSILKPGSSTTGNWTENDLTSSGIFVKNIIKNWDSDCNNLSVADLNYGKSDFELYPNPSNGSVTIKGDDIQKVEVFNVNGQLIRNITTNEKQINIDLNNLPTSLYFVNIITTNGVFVKKLVLK